jgi:hypothetical protein
MRRAKTIYTALLCLMLTPCWAQRIALQEGWRFSKEGDSRSYPASVPGTVHTDLLAQGLIPDPFYGSNEASLAWVDSCGWVYSCTLPPLPTGSQTQAFYLICEGLDTYADIYLNDSLLAQTDNMFRRWKIPLRPSLLRPQENTLRIHFHPALLRVKQLYEAQPAAGLLEEEPRALARKAQYHFGWDWGPKFVTAGIWKPIYIEIEGREASLRKRSLIQESLNAASGTARLDIETHLPRPQANYQLQVKGLGQDSLLSFLFPLPQASTHSLLLHIPQPQRWYPNGLGPQRLYHFEVQLLEDGIHQAQFSTSLGFKDVVLRQEADAHGRGFAFEVNGEPLFIKGANWIPAESFLPRLTAQKYDSLVRQAKHSHMNMLRVWGGGIYEDEAFYEACDRHGILVWQDFMFACALYPADSVFLANVAIEAQEQVARISSHPSVALWCGNNEISEGWRNWGWQKRFGADTARVWQQYKQLFYNTLPEVVSQIAPHLPYHPSSPEFGWGRKESMYIGDSHYWGVWWGLEPYSVYAQKVPRFMSEYGIQALPTMQSLQRFIPEAEQRSGSSSLMNHQRHPTGYQNIEAYMAREFDVPTELTEYAYLSQLVQAYAMQTAIEAQRRAKPYCMGTLYWQYNDCWPVVSWSTIDYYGQKKAAQYMVARTYAQDILSIHRGIDSTEVWLITDGREALEGALEIRLQDFKGNTIREHSLQVQVQPNSSLKAFSFKTDEWVQDSTSQFLQVVFKGPQAKLHATGSFAAPKQLLLTAPVFSLERDPASPQNCLLLTTDRYTKGISILYKGQEQALNENYFDLAPGQVQRIEFASTIGDLKDIEMRCYTNLETI